ncbi:Hypothetical protein A7982_07143 [Minicystis rosea]|nr:Hypothetical protein A7982_07143 [Minicystis rosea]
MEEAKASSAYSRRHAAFLWDHNLFNPLIGWAVLEWEGDDVAGGERCDVAYFLDPASAELDARVFRLIRVDSARRRPSLPSRPRQRLSPPLVDVLR